MNILGLLVIMIIQTRKASCFKIGNYAHGSYPGYLDTVNSTGMTTKIIFLAGLASHESSKS